MSITAYKLIKSSGSDNLNTAIAAALADNMQPYGNPIYDSSRELFAQAMVTGVPVGGSGPADGSNMVVVSLNNTSDPSLAVSATFVSSFDLGGGQSAPAARLTDGWIVFGDSDGPLLDSSGVDTTVNVNLIVQPDETVSAKLPATAAIVKDSSTLTGVAPTGAYTDTVTFTVLNGVITGIALS